MTGNSCDGDNNNEQISFFHIAIDFPGWIRPLKELLFPCRRIPLLNDCTIFKGLGLFTMKLSYGIMFKSALLIGEHLFPQKKLFRIFLPLQLVVLRYAA
jgi:hypothetical protein